MATTHPCRYKDVLDNTRENGQQTFAWALRMREIVNDHDGRVELDTGPTGTRFRVELAATRADRRP